MHGKHARLSDQELLECTGGDEHAYGVFYRRYERLILGYLLRRTRDAQLAADLTAETFAAALETRGRFDQSRAPDGTAKAWIFGIALNTLRMSARHGKVESERVQRELDALPAEQRAALVGRLANEREYAELAEELSCSELVVRKRVSRGLVRLRKAFAA